MAILKYSYLVLGVILYVFINVLSYTTASFAGDMGIKILYSAISLILLVLDYVIILKAELIFKRPFSSFTMYTKIMFYIGVFVIPMISLYYQS
ncbi:MAG: hypothetical protein A2Y45_05315 [Tenericutes bacterium GWC2_34_14]|nr:MAG: hypothetical protein A2Z84_06095 [Tenericutes bacterium GWA2_35_7]OHE28374.1 MAG: hypothetical protein A2Y45_05315 [Tenericutes bacterium GWC2_34_14]OHE33718.1 MAG: hypothetical protein A2012_04495 [Tenericutes bacterium GWE2_34_108]OHE37003.1 MAG: hypothetical protein A2Y46_10295 [Tenericutes bacterium GWF1_35_14]OHE37917.1 MAG: hypothetical protein A2Y44_08370 [Tenericutes bacterium GWF2_35_184]OHE41094.1 MAG: hypothetical protein A3K26_01375 [Tenericutes bacterium RIFOXYA12_FULL_35_